jgi:hypothetical protein
MGGWREGRCQEAGGEKLEECCKKQGQLAEDSKEGLGSEWAVVPMMMMMTMTYLLVTPGSRVLPEKLRESVLLKKFHLLPFYRTLWFITAFTSARHLSLP